MRPFYILLIALFTINQNSSAQAKFQDSLIRKLGFTPYQIIKQNDTIDFYVHGNLTKSTNKAVIFLSGSTPDPLFTYELKDGKLSSYFWGHQDFKFLPKNCAYIVVAKPGIAGMFNEAGLNTRKPPKKYLEKNSLDYRVWQADEVIKYCRRKFITKGGKLLVYGHSEGFNVAAKLVSINKSITHCGLWAGSAMPDYYDFMLFNRKDFLSGKISDSASGLQIDTLLMNYKKIFADPASTESSSIYTNKRWVSYSRPAMEYLKDVKIPIFLVAATKDDNAPYENSFIVPLEFIRLGKKNLTYKTCIGCNHSLVLQDEKGEKFSYWNQYVKEMFSWAELK